jgi:hypothetical protein
MVGCGPHHSLVRLFKWLRREAAWDPTAAQREAVLRLAESPSLVRTHKEGTTELLTIENNGLRRYMIARGGEVELVELGDVLAGFKWSDRLGAATPALILASVAAAVFVSDGLALILFPAASVAFLGHLVLYGKTFERAAPTAKERWDRVGGPGD